MLLKPLLTEDPFILYNQYICCRWPVNTKSQDINSHGIAPEELRLCNIHPRLLHWIFFISLLTDWQCNVYIYDDPVFGAQMQNTLVKVPIVLCGDRPWPSRSNLTWKSNFTSFWACPDNNQKMHLSTVKIPIDLGVVQPWSSGSI